MTTMDRPLLSRDVIAAAALELSDCEGLPGLSMRKLGSKLGVEAMSLYHYVSNKDDLLDAVIERLHTEIVLPDETANADNWRAIFETALTSFYDVLLRHPAAVELFSCRSSQGPNAFLTSYWVYQRCSQLGLSPAQASQMFRIAVSYVMGQAASQNGLLAGMGGGGDLGRDIEDPEVREFVQHNRILDDRAVFDTGISVLFDGFASVFPIAARTER